ALCMFMQSLSTRIVRALLPRRQLRSSWTCPTTQRAFMCAAVLRAPLNSVKLPNDPDDTSPDSQYEVPKPEHAVISTFDLFSIGGECFVMGFIPHKCIIGVVVSGPKQFAYSRTHACRQDLYRGSARIE